MATNPKIKTPWHLWAVGVLSLLWNAGSALDYSLIRLHIDTYTQQFTPQQLAFFDSFPQWAIATWGIATWFSVLGSVYILRRNHAAVPVFWIALLATVATAVHNFFLSAVTLADVVGTGAVIFTLTILAVAVGLVIYTRYLRFHRVLG